MLPLALPLVAGIAPVVALPVFATAMPGLAAAVPVLLVVYVAPVVTGFTDLLVHAAWVFIDARTVLYVEFSCVSTVLPFVAAPTPLVARALAEPAASRAAVVPVVAPTRPAPAVAVTMVTAAVLGATHGHAGCVDVRTVGHAEEALSSDILTEVRQVYCR